MGVLNARVGTEWVPISPGQSHIDHWNSAWGVIAKAAATQALTPLTTTYATVVSVAATVVSGRRYAVNFSARAMDIAAAGETILLCLNRDGVDLSQGDKYILASTASGTRYSGGSAFRWIINGDGATHTYAIRAKTATAATGTIHAQDSEATGLTIEDIGPVTRLPQGATPPSADWSAYDARYVNIDEPATPWTPVISTTGTAFNIGTTGTAVGWYTRSGSDVTAQFVITCGGTGITKGTGIIAISLPVPPISLATSSTIIKGWVTVTDNGVGTRHFGLVVTATSLQLIAAPNTTYISAPAITEATLGITTLAAGDYFAGQVTYQAA
jgi:hypothetical protein